MKIFIYFPFRSSDVSTEIVSIEQMFELKAINYCSMQTYRYIYLDDDDKYQSLKCARQSRSRELLAISFFARRVGIYIAFGVLPDIKRSRKKSFIILMENLFRAFFFFASLSVDFLTKSG